MKIYTVTIAANLRAYATIEIQAEDEEAALNRAKEIGASNRIWNEPEVQDNNVVFDPAYDTLTDFEVLDDLEEDA